MEQFSWTLVHFLWQGTLIAAVPAFAFALMRDPRWRYAVGVLGLAVMAAAPPVTWIVLQSGGSPVGRLDLPAILPPPVSGVNFGASAPSAPWLAWIPLV